MAGGSRRGVALHRSRQADAEWLRGEPQRSLPRRMPQRAPVPRLARRPTDHRGLADRLQPSPAAYEPSRSHPERVCNPVHQGPYGAQSPIMSEGMTGATSLRLIQSKLHELTTHLLRDAVPDPTRPWGFILQGLWAAGLIEVVPSIKGRARDAELLQRPTHR